MRTLTEFIFDNGLTMTARPTATNPNMPDPTMTHWRCSLRKDGKRMTVPFSMGAAHGNTPPSLGDVLHCLVSDSAGVEQSFEEWANELGYDTDSRSAERTYRVCAKQAEKLKALLGDNEFEALLYDTENK